jgi:outer membrane protein OmpA-like peptidoglycan-associated protein
MKQTLLLSLFIALFSAQFVQAQDAAKPLEIGVALGVMSYEGDVNVSAFANTNEMQPSGGIFVRKFLDNNFAVRGNLLAGKLTGKDANFASTPYRSARNYSFSSSVTEITGQLEWHILGNQKMDKNGNFQKGFLPYLFFGAGAISTKPTATFNSTWDTKNTSVANLNADKADGGSATRFGISAGGAINVQLTPNWILGGEMGMRSAFTDYFDGISKTANPNKQDWYVFGGLNLAYRLSNVKAKDEDTDGDGIPNSKDACPNERGTKANKGCPIAEKAAVTTVEEPKIPAPKPIEPAPVVVKATPPPPPPVEVVKPEPVKATPPPVEVVKVEPVVVMPPTVVTTTTTTTSVPSSTVIIERSEEEAMNYALQGVQFETGKSVLLSQSYKSLTDILNILKKYPSYGLEIVGNTDNQGNETANQQLSQRRAEACRTYLISKGIAASRMTASGLGSTQPIASNTTVEGRKQNRRVEFRLVTQ